MQVPVVQGVQTTLEGLHAAGIAAEAVWAGILASDLAEAACCFGMNAAKIAWDVHAIQVLHKFQQVCEEGATLVKQDIQAITQTDQGEAQNFQA
jgi:hypothetical protein